MSIYPFSSTYPRLGIQTTLSPARSSISSGDSDAFLGQIRYAILPASSDSTPRSPLSWPELCSKESRRHQNQITQPTQLAPFRIRTQSCSGYSATCISLSFCHFPELMTMGEGWDFHLALYSDQNLWARSQHTLTPFASGSNWLPRWWQQIHRVPTELHGLRCGVADSHPGCKTPRCMPESDVPKLYTLLTLLFEIFPMNTTNRIRDLVQLWQRTPTENPEQRIHLQFSLWLYRGHKARSNGNSKPYTCRTPHRTPWGTSRLDGWPQQLCKVKEQPGWNPHGSSWICGLAVGQSFLSNTLEIFSAFRQDQ